MTTTAYDDDGWCSKCGTEIKNGRSYCSECGAQIVKQEASR